MVWSYGWIFGPTLICAVILHEQVLGLMRPMSHSHAFLGLCAYGLTAAAFFLGGSFLLKGLL